MASKPLTIDSFKLGMMVRRKGYKRPPENCYGQVYKIDKEKGIITTSRVHESTWPCFDEWKPEHLVICEE